MSRIKIEGEQFIRLNSEALQNFYYYEYINKSKKEKQCFNTKRGCRVGVFTEYAVQQHLINIYGRDIINLEFHGRKERLDEKHFRAKPDAKLEIFNKDSLKNTKDIHLKEDQIFKENTNRTKEFKIEIKGITAGQPKGQVLVEHAQRYNNYGFTHIAFCELFIDLENKKAEVDIYLISKIKDIINYPIANNKFGKPCYTYPEYLYLVKSHK